MEMEALGGRQKCHLEIEGQVSRCSSMLPLVQRGCITGGLESVGVGAITEG